MTPHTEKILKRKMYYTCTVCEKRGWVEYILEQNIPNGVSYQWKVYSVDPSHAVCRAAGELAIINRLSQVRNDHKEED